jgi:hypothetical protein
MGKETIQVKVATRFLRMTKNTHNILLKDGAKRNQFI